LPEAFLADEDAARPEPYVVLRPVERAAAARRELAQPRQRRLRHRQRRDPLDRDPPAVRIEGIRRIPSDERRTRHRPAGLFDGEMPAPRAPERVPRAHVLAGELAFDARTPERAGHRAVECPAAADRDAAGSRPEIGEDAGEQLIALLPVAARHVKRKARSVA